MCTYTEVTSAKAFKDYRRNVRYVKLRTQCQKQQAKCNRTDVTKTEKKTCLFIYSTTISSNTNSIHT